MKKKLSNPFIVEGYAGDKYFCDRVKETETLLQALHSGRNVTMISPRRMGKSGLILHAFERVSTLQKDVRCFYIDIFHTRHLADFINVFANAIFGSLDNSIEKLYKTVVDVFKRCRPVITPDPITGVPQLSLNIESGQEEHTLKEIFGYLNGSDKRIYIAFDEFQQIAEYPESGVEALLRSFIQFSTNVSFVFAGSKKHLMQQMFSLPSRPFYQSTQTLSLSPINKEIYREFALNLCKEYGKEMAEDAFDWIYDETKGHTWYVQYALSRLFDNTERDVNIEAARMTMNKILLEEDDTFYMYYRMLTEVQRQVVTAIAKAGSIAAPISQEKIRAMQLPPASTVRSSLEKLAEKEILIEERGIYTLYNPYFQLWLSKYNR